MRRAVIFTAILILIFSASWAQEARQTEEKPPVATQPQAPQQPQETKYTNDSVARVSYVEGKTFVQRASDLGYEEGVLNMPVSEGDRLGTSEGRMEVHFGRGNYIRLDNNSKLDILNLPKKGDDITRIRVWSGSLYLVVGTLTKEKGIEVHTADSSFYVLDKGIYRVNVRENRDTEVLAFRGLIEAAGEGGSSLVKAEQRLEISEGRFSGKPSPFQAVADDGFDRFNQTRNSQLGEQFAKNNKKYLPEELEDYESELDQNGEWQYVAPYGNVWVPSGIDADWRPYWNGRWVWLGMSGWTWLPYEPWGWATFHYGRWHWGMGMGWYWIPMNMWGPAWVDWWWDDFYFGWAPLSFWGYPGILMGGRFYGGYWGRYYPYGSRALTVINRNQLSAPRISSVAVRNPATLSTLTKVSLSNSTLNMRPTGTGISVQQLNGNRVMLHKDGSSGNLVPDRAVGQSSGATSINRDSGSQGKVTSSQAVGKASSSGTARSSGSSSGARRIHKRDGTPASSASEMSSNYRSSSPSASESGVRNGESRAIRTYPSSPSIRGSYYSEGARSYSGGNYSGSWRSLYRSYPSTRSGSSSSGRTSSRSSRSSGKSSVSRSSGSHSSGGSRRK
jgi:hypothetical protein